MVASLYEGVVQNIMAMDGKGRQMFVDMPRQTGRTSYLICRTISEWTHDPTKDIVVTAHRQREADHIRARMVGYFTELNLPVPKIVACSGAARRGRNGVVLADHPVP